MTRAIVFPDTSRNGLVAVAAGGVLSGLLTPLCPQLIDRIGAVPGNLGIALVAVPFAVLVFIVVRWASANPWWAALLASIVTMVAFAAAVNAAVFIDGQLVSATRVGRNALAGLAAGFVGAGIMALGIALLPAGPRNPMAWLPMLIVGTVTGGLLALDNALNLDLTSVLYPVWQTCVAVGLATALRARDDRPG